MEIAITITTIILLARQYQQQPIHHMVIAQVVNVAHQLNRIVAMAVIIPIIVMNKNVIHP